MCDMDAAGLTNSKNCIITAAVCYAWVNKAKTDKVEPKSSVVFSGRTVPHVGWHMANANTTGHISASGSAMLALCMKS